MKRYTAFRFTQRHKSIIIPPKHRCYPVMVVLFMMAVCTASAENAGVEVPPVQVKGVFPNLTVMASDQIDHDEGQPQSGLWFGDIDDLWSMGKPAGWGGPWWEKPVKAGTVSDPFLMTGFDKKVVHLAHESNRQVSFTVEVDFLGNGSWKKYASLSVPAKGYLHHEFPDGFSAHWVRVCVDQDCIATVYFMYN